MSAPSDTVIGQSFTLLVTVRNKTSQSHSYRVRVKGRAMLYTGIPGQLVTSAQESITIDPHKCEERRVWGREEGGGRREEGCLRRGVVLWVGRQGGEGGGVCN